MIARGPVQGQEQARTAARGLQRSEQRIVSSAEFNSSKAGAEEEAATSGGEASC